MNIRQKLDMFFIDYDLIPLLIQVFQDFGPFSRHYYIGKLSE